MQCPTFKFCHARQTNTTHYIDLHVTHTDPKKKKKGGGGGRREEEEGVDGDEGSVWEFKRQRQDK